MDHAEAIDRETLPTLDLLAPENLYNPIRCFAVSWTRHRCIGMRKHKCGSFQNTMTSIGCYAISVSPRIDTEPWPTVFHPISVT